MAVIIGTKITQIYSLTKIQKTGQNSGNKIIPNVVYTAKKARTAFDIVKPAKPVDGVIPLICLMSKVLIPFLNKITY